MKTQEKIDALLDFASDIKTCRIALDVLRLMRDAAESREDTELFNDAADKVFKRGNALRVIENQKNFVGKMK